MAVAQIFRLRKHADYQRVYAASRKQFSRQMSFFVALRPHDTGLPLSPRVGLTVPKALGKAVDRNRIKRRMREAVRANLPLLHDRPIDVILHPRRSVLTQPLPALTHEIGSIFRAIQRTAHPTPPPALTDSDTTPTAAPPTPEPPATPPSP